MNAVSADPAQDFSPARHCGRFGPPSPQAPGRAPRTKRNTVSQGATNERTTTISPAAPATARTAGRV